MENDLNDVPVDFVEIDVLRLTARSIVKKMVFPKERKMPPWELSWFYIGRNTAHVYFRNLLVRQYRLTDFVKRLKTEMPMYNYYLDKNTKSLVVYLRGDKDRRRESWK
jgi:hypothetical protein